MSAERATLHRLARVLNIAGFGLALLGYLYWAAVCGSQLLQIAAWNRPVGSAPRGILLVAAQWAVALLLLAGLSVMSIRWFARRRYLQAWCLLAGPLLIAFVFSLTRA